MTSNYWQDKSVKDQWNGTERKECERQEAAKKRHEEAAKQPPATPPKHNLVRVPDERLSEKGIHEGDHLVVDDGKVVGVVPRREIK